MQNYTEEYREAYAAFANASAQYNRCLRICSVHEFEHVKPIINDTERLFFIVVNEQDCKLEIIEDAPLALINALAKYRYVYFTTSDNAAKINELIDIGNDVIRDLTEEYYTGSKYVAQ